MSDDGVGAFCAELRPRLVGSLSLHCGDAGVAEELAQETLTRVWEQWSRVRRLDSPEGWAYRVAMNLASSWFRRKNAERRAHHRLRAEARTEPTHARGADRADAIAVRQAVRELPRRRRTALVLRYHLDLSVAQTAEVMGCKPGTVKALCSQAIVALQHDAALQHQSELSDRETDHG